CLFIERAFDLLSPSGVLGYIIPNTLLIMKSYEPLRRYLLEKGWLKSIVDLSLKVFPEVEVPTCVLVVERKDPRALPFPRQVKAGFWESARAEVPSNLENANQDDFEKYPYAMFNIHIRSADKDILTAIERAGKPLGERFEVRDGINPANMGEKLVVKATEELDHPFKRVLRGKDISHYQLTWDNMWVRYDPGFADKSNGEYCFLREERIFTEVPKILTRQTADHIVAAYDENGYYALNTLHVTLPLNGDFDLESLLGLYNSRLLNYYYRLVFPDTERVFPQVKTVNLEKLPLPETNGRKDKLRELVLKALDPSISPIQKSKVFHEIDDLVYELYDLNPKQIARIESSPYTFSMKSNRR
ncbi:MAG: TaqI-like C-terminal specificity domain-containing protein, partial [bacterium]